MAYVIDTNVLLSGNVEDILKKYEVIIPSVVLREIENLERKKGDRALQFEVRRAKRAINKYLEDGLVKVDFSDYKNAIDDFEEDYADNIILAYALENNHALITNDILMKLKAKGLEIEVVSGIDKDENSRYQGFITEVAGKEELSRIYANRYHNEFNLLTNEYAVILDDKTAKVSDVLKWDGDMLVSLGDRKGELVAKFSTKGFGKFKTKDVYQLMAVDSIENNKVTMIRGKAGSGKALKNSTPVQTSIGPVPIGEIQVGDKVFGSDGKLCNVLAVHPQGQKQVWRVTFSDKNVIECCEEHLWAYQTASARSGNRSYKVATLRDIYEKEPLKTKSGKYQRNNIYIPMTKPVEYAEKDLFIHPYVMGALIGDGGFTGGMISFTNAEQFVTEKVSNLLSYSGYKLRCNKKHQYNVVQLEGKKINISAMRVFMEKIGLMGKKSEHKFIPTDYLYSSVEQRVQLLQGLIDTDGYIEAVGSRYEYATSSPQLAKDVQILAESLGLTCVASVKESPTYTHNGETLVGFPSYRLGLKQSKYIQKLHSSEKHDARWKSGQTSARRTITSIEPTNEMSEMTCITVDSPDALFLTDHYIVTHNTLIALSTAWNYVEKKDYRLLIFANTPKAKDSTELGYNKGSFLEKIEQSSLGAMLKSKFGGWDEVLRQIAFGNLTILPFSDLRGYDTTFGESDQNGVIAENTITLISEAQNLTSNLLKMGLQRIGENTKVIIDGDYHQQIDLDVYAIDNGMIRASEVFRGNDLYGEVELQNVYRSRVAEIAELM